MRVILVIVVLVVMLALVPAQALESLALYDDFNNPRINPNKWFGSEFGGTEALREVVLNQVQVGRASLLQGRLRQSYRAYGKTNSNAGAEFSALRLNFTNPTTVKAIRAQVQVSQFEVVGCPSNPEPTRARVRLQGAFFNAGTPTPGSDLNNVYARIQIQRRSADPPASSRVQAFAFRCDDALCNFATDLGFFDLGAISPGQSTTLVIQWDPDLDRFIFRRDATTQIVGYMLPDAPPPSFQFKRIDISLGVTNCTVTPRPVASMDVLIDDVFVNASAATLAALLTDAPTTEPLLTNSETHEP